MQGLWAPGSAKDTVWIPGGDESHRVYFEQVELRLPVRLALYEYSTVFADSCAAGCRVRSRPDWLSGSIPRRPVSGTVPARRRRRNSFPDSRTPDAHKSRHAADAELRGHAAQDLHERVDDRFRRPPLRDVYALEHDALLQIRTRRGFRRQQPSSRELEADRFPGRRPSQHRCDAGRQRELSRGQGRAGKHGKLQHHVDHVAAGKPVIEHKFEFDQQRQ